MASQRAYLIDLSIRAYRSCKNTEFSPNPNLSVLVGPNGSGKTNVLQAIRLLGKAVRRRPIRDERDSRPLKSEITATFMVSKKKIQYKAVLRFTTNERTNEDEIVHLEERWNLTDFGFPDNYIRLPSRPLLRAIANSKHLIRLSPGRQRYYISTKRFPLDMEYALGDTASVDFINHKDANKVAKSIIAIQEFCKNINYYEASQFTNPSLCPTAIEIDEDDELRPVYTYKERRHEQFLYDLYQASKNDTAAYDLFLSHIGNKGIGLIDGLNWKTVEISSTNYSVAAGAKVIQRKRSRTLVIPTVRVGRSKLSFNQLSEGTFKAIALLFYLMNTKGDLLLLEEPEVCVHHGLLKKITETIISKSKSRQIIFSTHADSILDSVRPDDVYIVKNLQTRGTAIKKITRAMVKRDLEALRKYLETSGTLGEYWRSSGFEA